jgi:hypothetical protein
MTVRMIWDDEAHSVIRLDFCDPYTWSDFHESIHNVIEEVRKQPNRVDLIITNSIGLPPGNALPHFRQAEAVFQGVPNLGSIMAVNPRKMPGFIKAMIEVVMRTYGSKGRIKPTFVNTLEEGRQRIAEDREQVMIA